MARPYFNDGIAQLEALFARKQGDPQVVRELEEELAFRKSLGARALLQKIHALKSAQSAPAVRDVSAFGATATSPRSPAAQEAPPDWPPTIRVTVPAHDETRQSTPSPAAGDLAASTVTAGRVSSPGADPRLASDFSQTLTSIRIPVARAEPQILRTVTARQVETPRAATPPARPDVDKGALLMDRYEVGALLGEGGMGRVFRAHDRSAGRPVALKMVRDRGERDRAALRNEVEVLVQLDRPDYFPRVYAPFEHDGLFVVPMDLIEGRNLRDHIGVTPLIDLDKSAILRIFDQVCDRLHYLHNAPSSPVLFKDLKPSNVMVLKNTRDVRLIDFGLSTVIGRDRAASGGVDGGTHGFWAPEAENDGRYSVQSDVFALGRLALCLILGAASLSEERLTTRVIPLGRDRGLPDSLLEVIHRISAQDSGDRPKSVRMAQDLLRSALETKRASSAANPEYRCAFCGNDEPRKFLLCAGCGRWQVALPDTSEPLASGPRIEFLRLARAVGVTNTATTPRRLELVEKAARLRRTPPYEELMCLSQVQIDAFPYQRDAALTVLATMGGRAVLADEVGLGKTIEAGLILKEYLVRGVAKRVLIIVPPGIRMQWRDELQQKFQIADAITFGTAELDDTCDQKVFSRPRVVVVVSSHTAKRSALATHLTSLDWDMLILDEAHHAKAGGKGNMLGRFASELRSKHMLLLTATPAQNNLAELFQLINLVNPGLLAADQRSFQSRYGGSRGLGWEVMNQETLRTLLKQVMVRNRRSDVHKAFPQRRADTKAVPLTPNEAAAYAHVVGVGQRDELTALALGTRAQQFCTSYRALVEKLDLSDMPVHVRATLAGEHFKLRFFLKTVAPQLVEERKILVFSRFVASQQEIAEGLTAAGYNALWACGAPTDRLRAVQRFRDEESVQYLVCGASLSEGHNLQFARCMVNFDLPWNPQQIEQRIGRVQRLGSRFREVQILNLVARNTVEDTVMEYIEGKLGMFKEVFGFVEAILGQFHEEGDSIEGFIREALRRGQEGQVDAAHARRFGERISEAKARAHLETDSGLFDALFEDLGTSEPIAAATSKTARAVRAP